MLRKRKCIALSSISDKMILSTVRNNFILLSHHELWGNFDANPPPSRDDRLKTDRICCRNMNKS
jgi:hypothetical protein